jgi:pyridoxal phosphate enzyme (YggS family)
MPDTLQTILSRNLADVRGRIDAAASRAGRDPASVTLVAVTKYVDAATMDALVAAGVADIGENRLQVAEPKFAAMTSRPRRHFIGTLQGNKVKQVLGLFDAIHAVDRLSLAEAIDRRATELGLPSIPCFVEVNVSGEASKSGLAPVALFQALREMQNNLPRVFLAGLMTMAPASDNAEQSRPFFAKLRQLRDNALAEGFVRPAPGAPIPVLSGLSMGMSGDFEVAVEEGATHVRIGTALYRDVPMIATH